MPSVWAALRNEAAHVAKVEPTIASLLNAVVLKHDRLSSALSYQLARKLSDQELRAMSVREIVEEFADRASNSPAATPQEFNDKLKEDTVSAEKTIALHLNTHVYGVEMASSATVPVASGSGKYTGTIRSVIGLDTEVEDSYKRRLGALS